MNRRGWAVGVCSLTIASCGDIESAPSVQSRNDAGAPDAGTASGWISTLVDAPSDPSIMLRRMQGNDLAIKVDDRGEPHVAYNVGGQFRHAWRESGALRTEVLDQANSMARKAWVADSDELRLVHGAASYEIILFQSARSQGGAWSRDSFEVTERSAAVSGIWKDGSLLLAYLQQIPEPEFDPLNPPWRRTLVFADERVPLSGTALTYGFEQGFTALAAGANGATHILYTAPPANLREYAGCADCEDPQTVRFVTRSAAGWSEPETLTVPGYYSGLNLVSDSLGNLHATFYVGSFFPSVEEQTPVRRVEYLTRSAEAAEVGAWQRETIPTAGEARAWPNSLALDSEGGVHVVYCDSEGTTRCNGVWHAHKRDSVWSIEPIETGCEFLGTYAALAAAPDGTLHAAYEGCERGLKYAHRPLTSER